jgi:ABC-type transport system involved in cytochrome c biogenesis permease component
MALLLDLSSVGLALAAGLMASAYCRQWNRALFLAEVLAAIVLFGFGILLSLMLVVQVAIPYVPGSAWGEVKLGEIILGGAVLCTDVAGMWSEAFKFLPIAATRAWLAVVAEIAGVSLLIFGLAIIWVARRVERSRQERPATTRQFWWQNYLFAPRFWKSLFRSKMRRTLERNPIGWLQQYSTTARMTRWGWCLFIVIAECVLVPSVIWYDLEWPQYWLLLLVALSLAASAAGSFRRERETGALELILVTPLSELEIILGRLFGLWKQFLPALGMLLAVLAFLVHSGPWDQWHGESDRERGLAVAALVACTFATLPVVGLYFSLSLKHFLGAWLSTLGVCVLLPVILPFVLVQVFSLVGGSLADNPFWPRVASFANLPVLTGGFQTVFALIAMTRLYYDLRERKFAFAS